MIASNRIEPATPERPPTGQVLPAWDAVGRVLREATADRAACQSSKLGDFAFRHGCGAVEADSPVYPRPVPAGDEQP